MSDSNIILIPESPTVIPEESRRTRALEYFRTIAPTADEIEIVIHEQIEFFHCGQNFGKILCPSCHSEIAVAW